MSVEAALSTDLLTELLIRELENAQAETNCLQALKFEDSASSSGDLPICTIPR